MPTRRLPFPEAMLLAKPSPESSFNPVDEHQSRPWYYRADLTYTAGQPDVHGLGIFIGCDYFEDTIESDSTDTLTCFWNSSNKESGVSVPYADYCIH